MKIKTTVQIREGEAWIDTPHSATLEADAAIIEPMLQMVERLLQQISLREKAVLLDGGVFQGAQCSRITLDS